MIPIHEITEINYEKVLHNLQHSLATASFTMKITTSDTSYGEETKSYPSKFADTEIRLQLHFASALSWMKMRLFLFKCQLQLVPGIQSIISHRWFIQRLGTKLTTSHCLKQL